MLLIIWLDLWAGKVNRISRCDWLPEWARWSYLARLGYRLCPASKIYHVLVLSHTINPLFGQDGCILALFFFVCLWTFFLVHKHTKKELGQYPAILTSGLVNNPYIYHWHKMQSALYLSPLCPMVSPVENSATAGNWQQQQINMLNLGQSHFLYHQQYLAGKVSNKCCKRVHLCYLRREKTWSDLGEKSKPGTKRFGLKLLKQKRSEM